MYLPDSRAKVVIFGSTAQEAEEKVEVKVVKEGE